MREPGDQTERADRESPDAPRRALPARRDPVDEASEQSFPASDPPATQPLRTGPPGEHPDHVA